MIAKLICKIYGHKLFTQFFPFDDYPTRALQVCQRCGEISKKSVP